MSAKLDKPVKVGASRFLMHSGRREWQAYEHTLPGGEKAMLVPLAEFRRLKKIEKAVTQVLNLSHIHRSVAAAGILADAFAIAKPAKKGRK